MIHTYTLEDLYNLNNLIDQYKKLKNNISLTLEEKEHLQCLKHSLLVDYKINLEDF